MFFTQLVYPATAGSAGDAGEFISAEEIQAAPQARFAPTKLSGQPVKVDGILTFNFSGQ